MYCSLVVRKGSFFFSGMSTQAPMCAINCDLRSPFLSRFAKSDTLVFTKPCTGITKVLRMCAGAQILNSVVISLAINVIKLRNKMPVVIHPNKVMHPVHFSVHHGNHVTFWLLSSNFIKCG